MATTNLHIPFPRPMLVGREEDLQRLHEALSQGDTAITPALTGQGGVGKTQLAVLYAHTYADAYPGGIFWLNAADLPTILPQLADYATQLGLPQLITGGDQTEYVRQRALQWVSAVRQHPDALVILDNLDDDALLREELPGLPNIRVLGLGCRVLITSRRRELPGCTDLPLSVLSPEATRTLLLRESRRQAESPAEQAAAEEIGALLGGLPLAVRLAGALLQRSPKSLGEFATLLRKQGAVRIMDDSSRRDRQLRLEDYAKSLAAVLAESWSSLPVEWPELKEVLLALSCLPPAQLVPLSLVRCLVEVPSDALGLSDPLTEVVVELYQRYLVDRPTTEHLRLHPLIHEYTVPQRPADLPGRLAAHAAQTLRSAPYLHAASSADLLRLLSDLPLLHPLATVDNPAARELHLLERTLDLQAHGLREGYDPLPHLHRQAVLLNDEALARACEDALEGHPHPWLRQRWCTMQTDPALRRTLSGHTAQVLGCALSTDGGMALSVSVDDTLRVWDVASGACRAVLTGHAGPVRGCALSADKRTALSASEDRTLRVWDVASGACRAVLTGHTDWVWGCALSADGGTALSASGDQTLRVWDVASQSCRAVVLLGDVLCCAIALEGGRVIAGDNAGVVTLFEVVRR
jgi:hypothetical protein